MKSSMVTVVELLAVGTAATDVVEEAANGFRPNVDVAFMIVDIRRMCVIDPLVLKEPHLKFVH